jgi:hypothetical protein
MIVYFIQAHRQPAQVLALAELLLAHPSSFVMVSYDSALPEALQLGRPNYYARASARRIHRGDFSPVDEYLDALRWLKELGIAYDWFVNLCAQCLPVQPVERISEEIMHCGFDAVMHHFPIHSDASEWSRAESAARLDYRYRKLTARPLNRAERGALKCLTLANAVQPWWRVHTGYGLHFGTQTRRPAGITFYGGSYFKYLSRACAAFLLDYSASQPAVMDYFRHSLVPDEIFTQTILLNQPFRVSGDFRMFFRFESGRGGHPRSLEVADLAHIAGQHFARKFDFESPAYREVVAGLSRSEVSGRGS